jgi:hypothetical protein
LLKTLAEHFGGLVPSRSLVVVTDGFAGLTEHIKTKYANDFVHVRCIQHLAESLQKTFKGKCVTTHLWRAARATHLKDFIETMHTAWTINPKAVEYLCPRVVLAFEDSAISKKSDPQTHAILSKMRELDIERTSSSH